MSAEVPMDKPEQIEAGLMPCPFCGLGLEKRGKYYRHPSNSCILRNFDIYAMQAGAWNTRTPSITGEDTELIERLRRLSNAHHVDADAASEAADRLQALIEGHAKSNKEGDK